MLVGGETGHTRVRLAELVAALSLGVDLGFGQPMEHVLRQCLIALRLADQAGLGEQDRMAVYYTALLVNVGFVVLALVLVLALPRRIPGHEG